MLRWNSLEFIDDQGQSLLVIGPTTRPSNAILSSAAILLLENPIPPR
jgi:hypothetical protein